MLHKKVPVDGFGLVKIYACTLNCFVNFHSSLVAKNITFSKLTKMSKSWLHALNTASKITMHCNP